MVSSRIERQELRQLVAELVAEGASGQRGPDIREKPTFAQWAGMRLLWAILIIMGAVILTLMLYVIIATPSVTDFGSPVTADSLAQYQRVSDLILQRVTSLLDLLIFKALLPVLTLVLGYVLGTRPQQSGTTPDSGT